MMYGIKMLAFLRARLLLVVLGVSCELVYVFGFLRQFPFLGYYQGLTDMGNITGHSHTGFEMFVLAFTVLFALVGFGWWEVRKHYDQGTMWLILGFGVVFAGTMIFTYPVTAIDVFGYVVQSLVLVQHHADPMITAAARFPDDPMMHLAGGWANIGAPYGPLGILIDAIPTVLVGRNLLANLLLLKVMFSAMLLFGAFLVYKILSGYAPKLALAGALLVAWNPQGFFEYSANGHNDIAVMLFVLLAIVALQKERPVLAFALIVASALIKYTTGLLVPLFLIYGLVYQPTNMRRVVYLGQCVGVAVLLVVAILGPFWRGPHTLDTFFDQDRYYISSFSTLINDVSAMRITLDQAKLMGRVIFGFCYLYALYLSTRSLPQMVRSCFITLFCFLAFATGKFEAWYAIWPALLAVLVPRTGESLAIYFFLYGASLLAAMYAYLWVWSGATGPMFDAINSLVYIAVFVPALLILIGCGLTRVVNKASGRPQG